MRILSREELDKIRERIIETQGSVTLTDWSEQLLSDRWDLFSHIEALEELIRKMSPTLLQ